MAAFGKAAGTVLAINLGFIGMFMFGPGLAVPVPTSLTPPSVCIAQLPVYQKIATLQSCLVAMLVSSIALCGYVKVEMAAVEGKQLAQMDETKRWLLRTCLLLGVVTSAATAAMGLATYVYVFQVKVAVFACVPVSSQLSLVASYAVAIVICAYVYFRFARAAIFSN